MMTDLVVALDCAMFTLLNSIELVIGTLARHLRHRPDLEPLVDRLLRFDTVGIYLVTERGHGLDAFNIETIATKTPQGFIINTPREEACKLVHATVDVDCCILMGRVGSCPPLHRPLGFPRSRLFWLG